MDSGSGGIATSSDFVRKLYKMLDNPADQHIVRWGNDGSSFVVLENEKFTKHILPKHFKHSNFASFVRQLNKYDFHKVRHNTDEGAPSPYGPNAWEFQHPDFKMNNKTSLENIRRKTPATRKQQYAHLDDGAGPLVGQMIVSQQQLVAMESRNNELSAINANLFQEVVWLRNVARNHERILQHLVNQMTKMENRPSLQGLGPPEMPSTATADMPPGSTAQFDTSEAKQQSLNGSKDDSGLSPLAVARKLLSDETKLDSRNLDHLGERVLRARSGNFISPPPDANGGRPPSGSAPHSAASSATLRLSDADSIAYPAAQTNGVDPLYSDNINRVTFSVPPQNPPVKLLQKVPPKHAPSVWIRRPRVMLVDDDSVCCKFGVNMLKGLDCDVVEAGNGYEAIQKFKDEPFDMILMDIIMPVMNGLVATSNIRLFDKECRIIAMTSNVSREDMTCYLEHGMADVLPKPFTRAALLRILDRSFGHLKKPPSQIPDADDPMPKDPGAWASPGPAAAATNGMLSPAASVSTIVDMMQGPSTMSMWLHQMGEVNEGQINVHPGPSGRPWRGVTNGAADGFFSGAGQRRDISQVSGGADDDGVVLKRQYMG